MYKCDVCKKEARYAIQDFKKGKVKWLCEKHFKRGVNVHCKVKKCKWNKNYKCQREAIHIWFDEYGGSCQEMELLE